MTPTLLWEQPPNPQLLLLHARRQITGAMAEKFYADETDSATAQPVEERPWLLPLLAVDGIREVHLLRHHLRLRKADDASWEALHPRLEAVLTQHWQPPQETLYQPLEGREDEAERRQRFALPEHFQTSYIQAFEGFDVAQEHPLAQALFAFPGIIVATFRGDQLICKRGGAYAWSGLRPQVDAVLRQFSTPGSLPGIQATTTGSSG